MSKLLVDFYKSVLETGGLSVVDGVVLQPLPDEGDVPVTVSKKTLVLPDDKWLGETDITKIQFFHPMVENVIRKESLVFKFLRRLVVISISQTLTETLQDLLHVIVSKEGHKTLDPITQLPVTRCAPEADKELVDKFGKLIDKIDPLGDNSILSAVVLRGKSLKGKDYVRVAKIDFPLLKALDDAESQTVYGVKFRKKDIKAIRALLVYVLPELDNDPEYYSTGSRSGVAPSLHALLGSFAKLVDAINKTRRTFGWKEIKLDWLDELNDFSSFKGLVPKLPGNDGEPVDGEEEPASPVETRAPARPRISSSYEEPDVQPARRPAQEAATTMPTNPTPTGQVSMADMEFGRARMPNYRWLEEHERQEGRRPDVPRDQFGRPLKQEGYNRPYGQSFNRQRGYQSNPRRGGGRLF